MSDERPSDVLGALPRRRPHRRSDKRRTTAPAGDVSASASASATPPAARTAKPPPAPKSTRRKPASRANGTRGKAPADTATGRPPVALPPAPARGQAPRLRQPAQPSGVPPMPKTRGRPEPAGDSGPSPATRTPHPARRRILGTAAQAAAELAEIGLSVSARALGNAIRRLPRP